MNELWLDERVLQGNDFGVINELVAIVDLASTKPGDFSFFVGSYLSSSQAFTQWINRLPIGRRQLLVPIVFRLFSVSVTVPNGWKYRVNPESELLENSSPAEIYESINSCTLKILVGSRYSSYSGVTQIEIDKIEPLAETREASSICSEEQLRGIGTLGGVFPLVYDLSTKVPPTDEETILAQNPNRFEKLKPQLHGRRMVYREITTGRLFYVDSMHFGASAHLEVFSPQEVHLGKADLMGNLIEGTAKSDREMHW